MVKWECRKMEGLEGWELEELYFQVTRDCINKTKFFKSRREHGINFMNSPAFLYPF
jgi:hypothetical protein